MLKINQITSDAKQKRTLLLPNGETMLLRIEFVDQQYGWFIRELSINDFKVQNIRITNCLNILHQYRNLIPYGLACISDQNREPTQIEDFSSDLSRLYILNEAEKEEYWEFIRSET